MKLHCADIDTDVCLFRVQWAKDNARVAQWVCCVRLAAKTNEPSRKRAGGMTPVLSHRWAQNWHLVLLVCHSFWHIKWDINSCWRAKVWIRVVKNYKTDLSQRAVSLLRNFKLLKKGKGMKNKVESCSLHIQTAILRHPTDWLYCCFVRKSWPWP